MSAVKPTMAEIRSPEPMQANSQKQEEEEKKKKEEKDKSKLKTQKRDEEPDLEPNIFVIIGMLVIFVLLVGTLFWYKVDNREHGRFAAWVNERFPTIDRALNRRPKPLSAPAAQETSGERRFTEEELKWFDGSDQDRPIYLAINGTVFDVSASPAFYGPGGHYHHFVGQDATRAWITECWDDSDQFTWRLDGVELIFMPQWLDEQIEKAGQGDLDAGADGLESMPEDMLKALAKKTIDRFGSVTDGEKKRRRIADAAEAKAKVQETVAHWVDFFSRNEKYHMIGSLVRDDTRPTPPQPCPEALKKRPMKGGKLDGLMSSIGSGTGPGSGHPSGKQRGEMPHFVKNKVVKEKEGEPVDRIERHVPNEKDRLVHEDL